MKKSFHVDSLSCTISNCRSFHLMHTQFIDIVFQLLNGTFIDNEGLSKRKDMEWNFSPFFTAVIKKDTDAVRRMIKAGTDVNERCNYNNCTSLHIVAREGNLSMVQLLLEHKADVEIKDSEGCTPLHYVSLYSQKEDRDIYKILLEKKANCNALDAVGNTPFHYVVKKRSLKTVKLMLDYGADIRAVNKNGWTALHQASTNSQHLDVLEFVLEHGLNIERGNNNDYSPLNCAMWFGTPELCEILLKRGASVTRINSVTGKPPLIEALNTSKDAARVVEVLLEHGANLTGTSEGLRVLAKAAVECRADVQEALMRHVAKMQYLNLTIEEADRRMIEDKDCYRTYHQRCVQELERMKETTFYKDLTILNVLLESEKVISEYAGDQELLKVLVENSYQQMFPIYFESLLNRLFAAVRKYLFLNSAKILSTIFRQREPSTHYQK